MHPVILLRPAVLVSLLMALVAALLLFGRGGGDIDHFIGWARSVETHGFIAAYSLENIDYPPLSYLMSWAAAQSGLLLGQHEAAGIKLSLLVLLVLVTAAIYSWSGRDLGFTFYAYLMLAINSIGLGYIDIYFAPFLLLAIYCFSRDRLFEGALLFTLAVAVKYHPLIVAPFFAIYLINACLVRDSAGGIQWLSSLRGFSRRILLPILLVLLPLLAVFYQPLLSSLRLATGEHHGWLTANALNLNYLVAAFIQHHLNGSAFVIPLDMLNTLPLLETYYHPRALFVLFYLITLLSFLTRPKTLDNLLLYALAGHLCYFILKPCVHENHLYLGCVLALALACRQAAWRPLALTVFAMSTLTLVSTYGFNGTLLFQEPNLWHEGQCLLLHLPDWINPCPSQSGYTLVHTKFVIAAFNTLFFAVFWSCLIFGYRKRDSV